MDLLFYVTPLKILFLSLAYFFLNAFHVLCKALCLIGRCSTRKLFKFPSLNTVKADVLQEQSFPSFCVILRKCNRVIINDYGRSEQWIESWCLEVCCFVNYVPKSKTHTPTCQHTHIDVLKTTLWIFIWQSQFSFTVNKNIIIIENNVYPIILYCSKTFFFKYWVGSLYVTQVRES